MNVEDPAETESWIRQRVLGSGGFGVVTLWKHKTKNQMIALKKCRWGTDQILTPKHKERWSKEVEIMLRLSHPNVVQAVDVPSELAAILKSDLPMLCMEFCSKGDLRQVLNRPENCCGLREPEVRALISDVSSAVKYLHYMKVTHRDLKPENIVLQPGEQRVLYKLIDLGYAKELDQSSICTSFVGTLQYLAPELFMSKNYTCSVDYWSLGLVSHEVMTGVRPFLPSMPPVSWMSHVSGKSSDDINAIQAPNGNIVFSKELFAQNHISTCLKYYMERWLKYCLEWDSKKRGREFNKARDGEIVVFHIIDDILNKAILSLYDSVHYRMLSYEIDESTALNTVQRWIERDTGLPVAEQELLLADSSTVDLEKEAWLCMSPKDPMLYLFKKGVLTVPEVTPQIPTTVSGMMQDPRNLVVYAHQIRAYAHAVFFIDQEYQLHKTFRDAAVVKLLRLSHSSRNINRELASIVNQLGQVEAQHQMNNKGLEFDQQQALKTSLISVGTVQQWKIRNVKIGRQIDKLKLEALDRVKVRCDSVVRKAGQLGATANPLLRSLEHDALHLHLETAMKCYENLRRRPKDKRHEKMDSVEMVKVVYNCLKTRDKLLRDASFSSYLNQIVSLQAEADRLNPPLQACSEMVTRIRAEVAQVFRDRQTDIWNHLNQIPPSKSFNGITSSMPLSNNELSESQSSLPNISPSSEISSHSSSPSLLNLKELSIKSKTPMPQPLKIPTQSGAVQDQKDHQGNLNVVSHLTHQIGNTGAMIHDNIALRYATQDLMNESFKHYRSILNEDHSLDWNFMT